MKRDLNKSSCEWKAGLSKVFMCFYRGSAPQRKTVSHRSQKLVPRSRELPIRFVIPETHARTVKLYNLWNSGHRTIFTSINYCICHSESSETRILFMVAHCGFYNCENQVTDIRFTFLPWRDLLSLALQSFGWQQCEGTNQDKLKRQLAKQCIGVWCKVYCHNEYISYILVLQWDF